MTRVRCALLALLASLVACPALAQGTTWGVEGEVNARYLWRGIPYSNDPVFQPYAWVTRGRNTVSVWSNLEMGADVGDGRFDQVFFTATRTYDRGRWHFEPTLQGYTWRGLPGEPGAQTLELSHKLSRRIGVVNAVSTQTLDVASYRGSLVVDAGVEWNPTLRGWRVESSATAAWANRSFNRTYVGPDVRALNYTQLTLAGTRTSRGGWYVRPHAEIVLNVDDTVRRALEARTRANIGVAVGREF